MLDVDIEEDDGPCEESESEWATSPETRPTARAKARAAAARATPAMEAPLNPSQSIASWSANWS